MGPKGIEEGRWDFFFGKETFSLRGDQHTQEFFGGSGKGLEGLIGLPFRHIKRVFFRYNTG